MRESKAPTEKRKETLPKREKNKSRKKKKKKTERLVTESEKITFRLGGVDRK